MVAPAERPPREADRDRPVQPKRILIADDDAAIRGTLVELLRGEGYETLEAKSGSEVLRIVPVEEPDLLLIDLRMPDQDGIQILKRLSAQDINDAGQITGRVRDHTTGQTLTFVATPVGSGRAEGARAR